MIVHSALVDRTGQIASIFEELIGPPGIDPPVTRIEIRPVIVEVFGRIEQGSFDQSG